MFWSRTNELSKCYIFLHRIIVFRVRVREILTMKIISYYTTESIYSLASRNPLLRIGFSYVALHQDVRNVALFLSSFFPFTWVYITLWFLWIRLRQRSIERAMDLTDSFTWEDLPTRDADTGHLTAAGWIPRINVFSMRAATATILFHFAQSTIRIVTNHETILIAWYPFDWTVSPFYELVNISQVTISIN